MKKTFLLQLFIICLPIFLLGQSIEDVTFLKVQKLREQLGLDLAKTEKAETILNEYNNALVELVKKGQKENEKEQEFNILYAELKKKRDKKLEILLDARQMQLFLLMEKRQTGDMKSYYQLMVERLNAQPKFLEELTAFHHQHKTPVLLHHKELLNEKISKKDSIELIDLGEKFNGILQNALGEAMRNNRNYSDGKISKVIKVARKTNPEAKVVWKRIKKMRRKYRHDVEKEYRQLDTYTTEWNLGIKTILKKYLPHTETKELNKLFFVLTQYGISRSTGKTAFLLFDEKNISGYYDIQRNAQALFLMNNF